MSDQTPPTHWIMTLIHDLRTPLLASRAFLELARQSGPLNEKQAHFVERAELGLKRLEGLIDDALMASRAEDPTRQERAPVELGALLRDVADTLSATAETQQVTLHLELPTTLADVSADVWLLSRAIENLLSNAIKYNRPQGRVWATVSHEADGVLLSVRDNGIGIPAQDLPRLFTRFQRASNVRKIQGSGLGLWTVAVVAERHGGRVWAESTLNEGTTLHLWLPRGGFAPSVDTNRLPHTPLAPHDVHESSDGIDDTLQEGRHEVDSDSQADQL
jgi:signal transduction histidine kinase